MQSVLLEAQKEWRGLIGSLRAVILNRHNETTLETQTDTNLQSGDVFCFLFAGEINVSKFAFTKRTTNLEIIQRPFLPAKLQRITSQI